MLIIIKYCRRRLLIFFVTILIAELCGSCAISDNEVERKLNNTAISTESGKSKISRDITELRKYITLPYPPTAVVWQTATRSRASSRVPGPTDYSLTAVLTFRQEDIEKIVAAACKHEPPRDDSIKLLEWFPAEIKKQAMKEPGTTQYWIKGKVYSAIAFYKLSLIHGSMLRSGKTPQLFLHLYTT